MTKTMLAIVAGALISAPAFAQTTTVTTQQQQPPPPPPPSSSTTVTTQQPAPANPGTQVVVNPGTTTAAPPPSSSTHVSVSDDTTGVTTTRPGRSAGVIVATDALYGGLAGAAVGGGIALINQGSNWQRDLMVGGGIGILVGAAFGVYEAVSQSNNSTTVTTRAAADRNPAESSKGLAANVYLQRF